MSTLRSITTVSAILAVSLSAGGCSKRKAGSGGGETTTDKPGTDKPATTDTKGPAVNAGIKIDGSSTVFLISQAVAEEYGDKGQVTVATSGTGGGFKKFCANEIQISGASRPIKPEEVETCKKAGIEYIELPVAYDGLAVVVNKKNTWVDHLTVEELKKIWVPEAQGKVGSWSQVREGWPDKPLHLFGPGVDSGTYDYFTAAIVGKEHSSRGDFTASEDDNVLVQGVSMDEGSLGFFGFAYYVENKDKLKIVPIEDGKPDNGAGPIEPSATSIADGTYQPLSRPIFIYVNAKNAGDANVKQFVDFYLDKAKALSAEVGYVPLPDAAYDLIKKRWASHKTGSVFAGKGSTVGVTIEKLLADEGS